MIRNNIKNKFHYLIGILFIFYSSATFAVGFGKIKVYSYLNENLSAEIELIGVKNIPADSLIASLASPKDFIRANLARPFFLTRFSFEIVRHEDKTVIYISSPTPVKYPFLEFLVELSWPDGKLVKEYTILIDPVPKDKGFRKNKKSLKQIKNLSTKEEETLPFGGQEIEEEIEVKEEYKPKPKSKIEQPKIEIEVISDNSKIDKPVPESAISDSKEVAKALSDKIEISSPEKEQNKANEEIAKKKKESQDTKELQTLKELFGEGEHKEKAIQEEVIVVEEPKNPEQAFVKQEEKKENINKQEQVQKKDSMQDEKTIKKYGKQLILSFLMVLISAVFIIKILKNSFHKNDFDVAEKTDEEHEIKDVDESDAHDDITNISNATDFGSVDIENSDEHVSESDAREAEIAEIESAILDLEKQEQQKNEIKDSKQIEIDTPKISSTDFDTISDITLDNTSLIPDYDVKKEIDTKIDLAQKYIEAGDLNSAKTLLDEIVDSADQDQKKKIEELRQKVESIQRTVSRPKPS